MLFFQKELEKRSKGQIQVELYFSGVLGSERELMDLVATGALQGTRGGFYADANPKFNLISVPFLVDDWDQALQGVHWLHVTGITPAISEAACQANLALVKRAKEQGITVSCDLNFRKKLWKWGDQATGRELARQCMSEVLPWVDLVIGNEEDAGEVLDIHAANTDYRYMGWFMDLQLVFADTCIFLDG